MAKKFAEDKSPKYFLTLFKIKGHTTWRSHLSNSRKAFDLEQAQWKNPPIITDKMIKVIDRLTGNITNHIN